MQQLLFLSHSLSKDINNILLVQLQTGHFWSDIDCIRRQRLLIRCNSTKRCSHGLRADAGAELRAKLSRIMRPDELVITACSRQPHNIRHNSRLGIWKSIGDGLICTTKHHKQRRSSSSTIAASSSLTIACFGSPSRHTFLLLFIASILLFNDCCHKTANFSLFPWCSEQHLSINEHHCPSSCNLRPGFI